MAFESFTRPAFLKSGDQEMSKRNAEHTGANLHPCNAADRLQARTRTADIKLLDPFDQKLEKIIRELTLRIMAPNWGEFDRVLESANKICDRYALKKTA
jgi:hypothetical protein